MPDIICLGEPIVDMVCPEPARDLAAASNFDKLAGGAPLKVAASAARLGASSGVSRISSFLAVSIRTSCVNTAFAYP